MSRINRNRPAGCLLPLALLVCADSGLAQLPEPACANPRAEATVVVVRHADRDGELLNDRGKARARALRALISAGNARVSAVLHSQYKRTRQTVEPILEDPRYRDRIEEITFDSHAYEKYAAAIRRIQGKGDGPAIIVVAAHSNTVRPLLEQFSKSKVSEMVREWFPCDGEICHSDYDDLWTITLCGDAPPSVEKINYGQPTPNR